jgi:hypothetical protein
MAGTSPAMTSSTMKVLGWKDAPARNPQSAAAASCAAMLRSISVEVRR